MKLPDPAALQAIIFDVGGVMLRTYDHAFRHAWDAKLEQPFGTVEELVFNSELGSAAQTGRISTEEHWRGIGEHLGLSGEDLAALRRDFWAGDRFDFAMIDWIRSWRDRYQTAIISNAFDDLRLVLTEEFAVGDAFDLIVVSAEEGIMKPDPEIYRRTLARLNCLPSAALFIDDNMKNISGAQAIGLNTIHFQTGIDLPTLLPLGA